MGRYCADCGIACASSEFSSNQWRKGEGYSRCMECVDGTRRVPAFQCSLCNKTFENQNNLTMHMQVHRPRNVACPVCGETRFASGANAVQHVESGYCTGCRGQDNARQQIYKFAQAQGRMRPYLSNTPLLTDGNYHNNNDVPDYPYGCPDCHKAFRQLSQLLQHQDQKHGNRLRLTY